MDAKVPTLRSIAFEAIGRLALRDRETRLHAALDDEDATCRFWAAWSTVRLGERAGIPVLGRFAAERGACALAACDLALRALDTDQAVRAQQRLLSITGGKRLAVAAAGIIGDPTLARWLLDAMGSAQLARPAGAAFSLMTGCDLRRDDLDGEPRLRSDADVDVSEDEADEHLAWPDTERIRRWWKEHRQTFLPGARYLAGLPIRPAELGQVLRTGNQHQRAAAALELALLDPHAPVLDVTAPAHWQVRLSERH